jgi:AcrR family transcriptional regulator
MEPPRKPHRRYARRLSPTERREQLLDVALDLVVESGYGALSMHAIARRAEVTRPVVYDSFASKDELISALVRREETRMRRSLAALAPPAPAADPASLLVDVFAGFLLAVQQNPATWRLVYTPPEGTPDILRNHIAVGRTRVRALLEPLLASIARSRDLTTDIELAAHLAQSIGEMSARLILTDPTRYPPDRLTTFITQLLLPTP